MQSSEAPHDEEVEAYVAAIQRKYEETLGRKKVWGAADGLKNRIKQSTNWAIQRMHFNFWVCDTYINSVLVFVPDKKICMTT